MLEEQAAASESLEEEEEVEVFRARRGSPGGRTAARGKAVQLLTGPSAEHGLKTMSLSRVENPCFLLSLFVFQAIFILILYRGGPSSVFRGFLDPHQVQDYSKTHDVYTNLSLFTQAPNEEAMPYCSVQSPIFGRYEPVVFEIAALVSDCAQHFVNLGCVFFKLFHFKSGILM